MRAILGPKPQERLSLVTSIQFVVELEFLTPPISGEQIVPGRDRSSHYFASALQDAGLQAAFLLEYTKNEKYSETKDQGDNNDDSHVTDGQNQLPAQAHGENIIKTKHNGDMFIMSPQSSIPWIKAGAKDSPLLRYWLIKPESDISGHGKYEAWHPTALTSPILRESEANNLFPGLNTAIYTIWTAHAARVHVNDGCGLHIHVSPALVPSLAQGLHQGQHHHGQRQDLTALQVQRIATLVVVLENSLLFHLCSPHRRQIHNQLIAASSLAYAANSPACPLAEANLPPNILKGTGAVEKAIKFLWTASGLDQVRQMLSRHPKARDARPTALTINTHKHEDDGVSHMLEFRHAQAAFNQGFVDNWARLVLTETVRTTAGPREAWKTLLRVLNDFAPVNWHARSSEQFWVGQLAVQDRK
ncbi:uncharacterized protein Triagg1_7900 [Trichoderma aggressivum f. europaeum]|uniref:Amidoligase enzyme n=1 Tax=Trichoderma aggressivum f. europaeum TaxID=173218 RepID=A0AAE1I965_9HYPO|nr:hypothetical protein Triagg1_7900 [Trichoderma aggressivum f. europaeum]